MSCCKDHAHESVTTAPAKPASSKSSCQCEQCRDADTCCDLICFERPNYFCGHLLTDADLLKEQTYSREKSKLYHRSFHGHGIVCGLRIMCDSECEGYVRIEEGYAIDDCGNDLIVCNPLRFNVIKALRDKGWLVEQEKPDPCAPKKPDDECHTRQCFHVAACYHEEPADFTAPFVPGCNPKPADCEPTRIREMVTFDVLNELPVKAAPLDDMKARIEACFELFSKGQFAQYLQQHGQAIEAILSGSAEAGSFCRQLFCDLRGLLLLYLKKHPDRYNCRLEAEIRAIPLPEHAVKRAGAPASQPEAPTNQPADAQKPEAEHLEREPHDGCRDAICRLIELATRYVYTCAMNEFVPHCPHSTHANCVVLGTVEVERGEIVRICNCPRDYVWSFANFFEVLAATLYGNLQCEDKTESSDAKEKPCGCKGRHVCCRDFDVKCETIVRDLLINSESLKYRGTAPFDAVAAVHRALGAAFDFTRTDAFAPAMFTQLDRERAMAAARIVGIPVTLVDAPLATEAVAPFDILRRIGLATTRDALVLATDKQDRVITSYAEVPVATAAGPAAGNIAEELNGLRDRIARLEQQLQQRRQPDPPEQPPEPPTSGPTGAGPATPRNMRRRK
jgi:hypothetical protein